MPSTNIVIQRPLAAVWDFFVDPDNWAKWWAGGSPRLKEQAWQVGGNLIWGDGSSSEITEVIPQSRIQTSGRFMSYAWQFTAPDAQSTVLDVEFSPKGGASLSDGGMAHKTALAADLAKLKEAIEQEAAPSSHVTQSAAQPEAPGCLGAMAQDFKRRLRGFFRWLIISVVLGVVASVLGALGLEVVAVFAAGLLMISILIMFATLLTPTTALAPKEDTTQVSASAAWQCAKCGASNTMFDKKCHQCGEAKP